MSKGNITEDKMWGGIFLSINVFFVINKSLVNKVIVNFIIC